MKANDIHFQTRFFMSKKNSDNSAGRIKFIIVVKNIAVMNYSELNVITLNKHL